MKLFEDIVWAGVQFLNVGWTNRIVGQRTDAVR